MSTVVPLPGSRIANFFSFRRDPLGFLVNVRDYGDIVALPSGKAKPSFVVNAPSCVHEVLVTKASSFVKGRSSRVLRATLGDGLLTTEGAVHDRQRRQMQPPFHRQQLATYADDMVRETVAVVDTWRDGDVRSTTQDMMDVTLRVITKTMFDEEITAAGRDVTRAVDVCIEHGAHQLFAIAPVPAWIPTKANRTFQHAVQALESVIYDMIGRQTTIPPERMRLLSLLLHTSGTAQDDAPSIREVRDQAMTILIAGHETTANALSWALYLLARNPQVEAAMLAELDSVLGNRDPGFDDFAALEYTQHVVQETLRLFPTAWGILREVHEPVTIGDAQFAPGSLFILSPYAAHRNPAYFPDPLQFRPERFAADILKEIPRYAYYPFGGGVRSCIGSHFALLEATLLLAVIVRRFRVTLPDVAYEAVPDPLISLRIRGGLTLRVAARS